MLTIFNIKRLKNKREIQSSSIKIIINKVHL
jgi:hypothetical protein